MKRKYYVIKSIASIDKRYHAPYVESLKGRIAVILFVEENCPMLFQALDEGGKFWHTVTTSTVDWLEAYEDVLEVETAHHIYTFEEYKEDTYSG